MWLSAGLLVLILWLRITWKVRNCSTLAGWQGVGAVPLVTTAVCPLPVENTPAHASLHLPSCQALEPFPIVWLVQMLTAPGDPLAEGSLLWEDIPPCSTHSVTVTLIMQMFTKTLMLCAKNITESPVDEFSLGYLDPQRAIITLKWQLSKWLLFFKSTNMSRTFTKFQG